MKKILYLNYTIDQQNWGAQIGARALKEILTTNPSQPMETLGYCWMEEKYSTLPKWLGGKTVSNENVGRVGRYFSQPLRDLPLIVDEYEYVADMWQKSQDDPIASTFIEMCKNIDSVVLNGEGSIYRNNYTAIKGLFLLWFAKKYLKKSTFFVNGSVHITRVDPILPAMVRKTFGEIDKVAVREPWSQRNLKEFYPNLVAEVIPDSVFYLFDEINSLPDAPITTQNFCAFSPPMLLTAIKGVYRAPHEHSMLYNMVVEIKKLIPQVIFLAKEPRDSVLQKLAEDTGSIFFGANNSVNDLISILRQAKFLISGRYHHLILASILGIPCIPMATTSHKIHGLCELFGGNLGAPYDCTDLRNESERLLSEIPVLLSDGKEIGANLQKYARRFSKETLLLRKMVGVS